MHATKILMELNHNRGAYLLIEVKYWSRKSLACFSTSWGVLSSFRPGWAIMLPRHIWLLQTVFCNGKKRQ